MNETLILKRYVRALLKLTDRALWPTLELQANELHQLIQDPTLPFLHLLKNPSLEMKDQLVVLETLCAQGTFEPLLKQVWVQMIHNGRFAYLFSFARVLQMEMDEAQSRSRVHLQTAKALSPAEQQACIEQLKPFLKTHFIVTYEHQPKLLGGMRAQIGDIVVDSSISNQLKKIQHALMTY